MSEFNSFAGCKPNMSFMPAYEDINEAVFYMASSAEHEYAKLESAFNMAEVLGESYLVEETGIKGWFENIIKWVKEQFEKLAGLFQKAIDTLQKKTLEFSNKVKNKIKDKTKVSEKLKNLKGGDKVYGKVYEYTGWDFVKAGGKVWQALTSLENLTKDLVDKVVGTSTGEDVAEGYNKSSIAAIGRVLASVDIKEGFNTETFAVDTTKISNAIEEKAFGKEKELKKEDITGSNEDYNFEGMWKRTTDGRQAIVDLQKDFKELKKYYDNTIKALKGAAKEDAKNNGISKDKSGYTVVMKAVKAAKSLNNCIGGTAIKLINKRMAKEQMIVWRCVAAATVSRDSEKKTEKAQEKLKASQEAASIEEVTAQLFDFG